MTAREMVEKIREADDGSGEFRLTDEEAANKLEEWAQARCEAVIDSILSEALNSGDGTYRP